MTSQHLAILRQSRGFLTEQVQELSEMAGMDTGNDVDTDHSQGEPGEGGAMNVSTSQDDLNTYLVGIADVLLQEYETDKEDAIQFVYDMADELAESGDLPELPDTDSSDQEATAWLMKARGISLSTRVLQAAHERAEVE